MTESDQRSEDTGLDALFDAARAAPPAPSDDLMARIVADAAEHQPVPPVGTVGRKTIFGHLLEAVGGWPALGGLVTAAVTGVYIGFAQPDLLGTDLLTSEDTDFVSVDLWPGDAMFFEEG